MSRPLVVNASPLILLHRIGRLDLLTSLSDSVSVPEAVIAELHAGRERDDTGATVLSQSDIRILPDTPIPDAIRLWDLGPGESQVIACALRDHISEAVLDDRAARRCARALALAYTGTLGIVLRARQRGIVHAVRPIFEELQRQGIRLSPDLVATALEEVGE